MFYIRRDASVRPLEDLQCCFSCWGSLSDASHLPNLNERLMAATPIPPGMLMAFACLEDNFDVFSHLFVRKHT